MGLLRKMRAVAGVFLLSTGLGMATDSVPVSSNPQVAPIQSVPNAPQTMMWPPMQTWPQMVPIAAPPNPYWVPPPGMMWPMPPQYPGPMAMPPVPWMPVMWVLVPVPAEAPKASEPPQSPAVNIPIEMQPPPAIPAVSTPSTSAAPSGGGADVKADTAMPASVPETPPVLPVQPASKQPVNYGPVTPVPVIKLPAPEVAPATAPTGSAAPVNGAVESGKTNLEQAPGVQEGAVFASFLAAPVPAAPAVEPVNSAPSAEPLKGLDVDYGPVAPTPVVDLLALMEQVKPSVSIPAKPKRARKPSVSAPSKPAPAATKKPVKQRMCWTKGVVAPCR